MAAELRSAKSDRAYPAVTRGGDEGPVTRGGDDLGQLAPGVSPARGGPVLTTPTLRVGALARDALRSVRTKGGVLVVLPSDATEQDHS